MRPWKKALIALVAVVLVLAAALGIFLATFDIQKYRPLLQEKISEAMGAPVTMGHVSLGWKNGIAVRLDELSVFADDERKQRLLYLKSISATVRLFSLFAKQVDVSSLYLDHPTLRLVRRADGSLALPAPRASSEPEPPKQASPASSSPKLSMSLLQVTGGEIVYEDRAAGPDATVSVTDIDLRAKDISFDKPFPFTLAASVYSQEQNVQVSGLARLPREGRPGRIEGLKVSSGLADWDIERLSKRVPALGAIEGNIGGRLEVEAKELPLDATAADAEFMVRLQNAAFKPRSTPFFIEKVQLEALLAGEDLHVGQFSAALASGTLRGMADLRGLRSRPQMSVRAALRDLSIEELSGSSQGRHFSGRLSVDIEAKGSGAGPAMTQSLTGRGRVGVQDGRFHELNLLREVVSKASMIPGAEGVLERELPPAYQQKLAERDTLFLPVDMPYRIEAGRLIFDELAVSTEFIRLQGRGWMGLDRSFGAQTVLQVHPTLSKVMTQIVSPIQLLLNQGGELEAPIQFSGRLPQVKVMPDTRYLAERLLTAQAQQLLTGFVQDPGKGLGKVGSIFDSQGGGQSGLQSLLRRAVGGQTSSTEGQSQ